VGIELQIPFLAALRSAAQMVSYEVSIGFVIITCSCARGSLNLNAIVDAQEVNGACSTGNWLWLFPMFVCSSSRHWPRRTGPRSI